MYEKNKIKKLLDKGYTIRQVCDELNCKEHRVFKIKRKLRTEKLTREITFNGKKYKIYPKYSVSCTGCIFNRSIPGLNCLYPNFVEYNRTCKGVIWCCDHKNFKNTSKIRKSSGNIKDKTSEKYLREPITCKYITNTDWNYIK